MSSNVSVVIPTYNGKSYIREALESVFAQTLLPTEIIVVDDKSTDGTPDLVEEIANAAAVPTRLIRMPFNSGGPSKPINSGIQAASTEFVSVLDQDDVFAKRKLERDIAALKADPDLSIVCGWCGIFGSSGIRQSADLRNEIVSLGEDAGSFVRISGVRMLRRMVVTGQFLIGYPAFTFRRSSWLANGGIDETLRIAGDMDLLGKLFAEGDAALIPEIAYFRREHEENACRRRVEMYTEESHIRTRLFKSRGEFRADRVLERELHRRLLGIAFWFREAREYAAEREVIDLIGRLGEARRSCFVLRMKSRLHQLHRWATRRPPVHTPFTHIDRCPQQTGKVAVSG